jgi:hypothetical protein
MSDTKIKTSNIGNLAVTHALLHTDMDLTSKTVQVATPTSNTHPATKAYVDTEVANLIDSAPGTLDTLNELAAAVNDDANFNATIASSIATKLPLAGGTMTGNLQIYKAEPIITLQRSNNALLPGISWQGSGGAEAASIKLDGTSGATNTLIMSTYNGSTMAERLRLMTNAAGGIAVTGTISVTGTVDGVDIAARDAILTSTTTTADAALPKAGGTLTGDLIINTSSNGILKLQEGGADKGYIGAGGGGLYIKNLAGDVIFRNSSDADTIRIKDSGNVGIGTTNPTAKLQVEGTFSVRSSASQVFNDSNNANNLTMTDTLSHFNFDGADKDFQVSSDNLSHALFVRGSDGAIGMGTSGPNESLHIYRGSGDASFKLQNASQILRFDQNSIRTTTNSPIAMFTNNTSTQGFRIENDGRMIIGQTAGQTNVKLTVAGNVKMGSAATSSWANTINDIGGLDIIVGSGSTGLTVWDDNSQSTPRFKVTRAGNVGIGTASPGYLLHAENTTATGPSYITTSANGQFIMAMGSQNSPGVAQEAFIGTLSDQRFKVKVNNVEKATFTSTGLGIGTTNPGEKLHVEGSIRASENIGVTQPDGDYLAKLYQTSADGFLELSTGEASPVVRTKLGAYGTNYIAPTGTTSTNQAMLSVGETIGAKTGVFNIRSTSGTVGGYRHRMVGGTDLKNVASAHTGAGTLPYWHIKTNIAYNQNVMFVARVHGYAYGNSGHIIDVSRSGYAYSGSTGSVISSQLANSGSTSFALDTYYANSGANLCFRFNCVGSYYLGVAFDIKMQSPTGYNHDFAVEAHVFSSNSGNYYT